MSKNINPLEGIATPTKPNLVVFFVIDKSGSMEGTNINAVNHAMREMIPILQGIGGSDADLKIAVLTFSAGAEWLYSTPQDVDSFVWRDIEADGWTDFGAACDELCKKMSRKEFMNSALGYKKPIVILLTDGEPTDNWQPALAKLKQNKWFQSSIKIGLAVEDADDSVIGEFVGAKKGEGVYRVDDTNKLKNVIKVVVVTSSEIGSKSMPIDISVADSELDNAVQEHIHKTIRESIDDFDEDSAIFNPVDDDEEGWD